jgi:hypothetical protein
MKKRKLGNLAAPLSFYASNRDGTLASVAPARHFPVPENNCDDCAGQQPKSAFKRRGVIGLRIAGAF